MALPDAIPLGGGAPSKGLEGTFVVAGASTAGTFRATVTTAGTAEQLANNVCKRVIVQALSDNTDAVEVGDSNVVAAEATQRGVRLFPTQSYIFFVNNTNLLYIDSVVNGEGVSVMYEN